LSRVNAPDSGVRPVDDDDDDDDDDDEPRWACRRSRRARADGFADVVIVRIA